MTAERKRLTVVLAFILACAAFVGYLWHNAGGSIPLVTSQGGYRVAVDVADVDNMVPDADVDIAGVKIGHVVSMKRRDGKVHLVLAVTDDVAELHRGVTVQVSEKSLFGQPYVKVVDGTGPSIPSGTTLPARAVHPSVQLHDVLAALNGPTRKALRSTLRDAGLTTRGTSPYLNRALTGLGNLGEGGYTALDALQAQSSDLSELARQLPEVLDALDSGQQNIGTLVTSANRLLSATAGEKTAIDRTVEALPATLTNARSATTSLTTLADTLRPTAANLLKAAPNLNAALLDLAPTTRDLNGLLPSLNGTLNRAPATLTRVPTLATALNQFLPDLDQRLRDLNPIVRYASPYGMDIGSFLTNFAASYSHTDTDGHHFLALLAGVNDMSVRGNPINLGGGILAKSDPYPKPGSLLDLRPFTGKFKRLYRDPQ